MRQRQKWPRMTLGTGMSDAELRGLRLGVVAGMGRDAANEWGDANYAAARSVEAFSAAVSDVAELVEEAEILGPPR